MGFEWTLSDFAEFSIVQVGEILDQAFEGYEPAIRFTPQLVASMMRNQGVDLLESRLLLADGRPAGAAMVARRGAASRVASIGVFKPYRGHGGARFLMNALIREARERHDDFYELECVETNAKAAALYSSLGFHRLRLLVGYTGEGLGGEPRAVEEVPLIRAARLIGASSVEDAPWMLSGEALAYTRRPCQAFRHGGSAAIVNLAEDGAVELRAVPMTPDPAVNRDTEELLRALFCRFGTRVWRTGPFMPDDLLTPLMERLGFRQLELKQAQWRLDLQAC